MSQLHQQASSQSANGRAAHTSLTHGADHMLSLAMQLRSQQQGLLGSLGIIGDRAGTGASTIAAGLAHCLSWLGNGRFLLIHAHPKKKVTTMLGLASNADALSDKEELQSCLQRNEGSNLDILAAQQMQSNWFEPIRFSELIDDLKSTYDAIVVDLPPANGRFSGVPLAAGLDAVILTLEAERSRIKSARDTKQRLMRANANVLGFVFNKQRDHVPTWLRRST